MKKLKTTLITCLCLCFALMGGTIFVACSQNLEEEINPYIKVSGLSTACMVGDELDYSNAKILYYTNLTDETPEEIALTRDMITGFSSDTAGTSTLKVTYKSLETSIDYTVVSEEKFTETITNATTKMYNTNNTEYNQSISQDYGDYNIDENIYLLIKDLNIYTTLEGNVLGDIIEWYVLDLSLSDDWRNYSMFDASDMGIEMGVDDYNKIETVDTYSPSEIIKEKISGVHQLYLSNELDDVLNCDYAKFNNKEVLTIEFIYDDLLGVCVIEINNSKITKITTEIEGFNYKEEITVTYDISNKEIPQLPENVEFIVENEEFIEIYNTARNTIMNSNQLTATMFNDGKMMNIYESTNIFVGNNTMYKYVPNVEKSWKQKDGEIWYDYTYKMSEGTYTKKQCANQSGLITEENIINFLPQSDPMSEEALEDVLITCKKTDGKDVYFCDFMELGNHSIEWTFENGKLIKFEIIVPTNYPEKTEFEVGISMEISYSVDLSNIPTLPNVEWTEVTE